MQHENLRVDGYATLQPNRPDIPPPTASIDGTPARFAESDVRVLVIEVDRGSAQLIESLLRRMGYDVRVAGDSGTAARLALAFRPDVILSNLDLPDRDGCELVTDLLDDPALRHTTPIALSDHGSPAERERARSVGFELQLVKPLSPGLLKAAMDSATRALPALGG